ncbi:MAG: chitosanase [Chloracidobacterium sp.]|nr:chitosanase [Chloracidobacterium sp.]
MTFSENDKLKALGIVNVFETSRPFGEYAACVVLDDGAGVSYGVNQFTHRSGSLAAVVEAYLSSGGQLGREILAAALSTLNRTSTAAINKLSRDTRFKQALRAAAVTSEMKAAQQTVAFEKYLLPAIQICEAKGFVLPLSLAVVYDSLNHGSFEYISARVTPIGAVRTAMKDAVAAEKKWITEYVRERDRWLSAIKRLRVTRYRTKFFLDQIAIGNWDLKLPMTVHGFRLTKEVLASADVKKEDAVTVERSDAVSEPGALATGSILNKAGKAISSAADKFDRVSNAVTTITTRTDAAKSLWTTVIGTIWQAMWAIFSFLAGLPQEVWIVVAVIAAVLMVLYLYRQIELGRIRERSELRL